MQEYLPVFQQQLEQMQKEELRRKAELLQSRLPEPAPAPQQPAAPGKDAGKPNEEK